VSEQYRCAAVNAYPEISSSLRGPTVLIIGPPWPRSGTARVMQNQIEYYRSRGFSTVLICVPIHCSYTETHPDWHEIQSGILEMGADKSFFAMIDPRSFKIAKYVSWIKHLFHGTALDWIIFTARSAQLSTGAIQFLRGQSIALVHVNHVFTLGFAQRVIDLIGRSVQSAPIILDTHDIQSNALRDRDEMNPWTHRRDPPDKLLDSEIVRLKQAMVLIHVSTEDFEFFRHYLPSKHHVLALPTIDESFVLRVNSNVSPSATPIDLLFVGHSTAFNAAAVNWFFREVWPLVERQGYSLAVVGSVEVWVRKEMPKLYAMFRSYFAGPVAELEPCYRAARCVIAPMVSGTGISIKTVEAFALGKPFVGTSKAFRGMPMDVIKQSGIRAHDCPQDFANAINQALSEEHSAAAASRAVYRELFSNRASFSARDQALKLAAVKTALSSSNL